jgi:hypothetical protein
MSRSQRRQNLSEYGRAAWEEPRPRIAAAADGKERGRKREGRKENEGPKLRAATTDTPPTPL